MFLDRAARIVSKRFEPVYLYRCRSRDGHSAYPCLVRKLLSSLRTRFAAAWPSGLWRRAKQTLARLNLRIQAPGARNFGKDDGL